MYRIPAKLLIIALSFQFAATGTTAEQSDKPNVLMICIDVVFAAGVPLAVTQLATAVSKGAVWNVAE